MGTVVGANFAFPFGDFESEAERKVGDVFERDGTFDPEARRFLAQIHEDAVAEDLESLSVDDMVFLAAGLWAWIQKRPRGEPNVRLEPGARADGAPLNRDILEICTDDKPFIVDSVMGEINARGVDVLAMFHPIVAMNRDARGYRAADAPMAEESVLQVHLEPLDEETRTRLKAGVRETLADVNAAVDDYADMRARMDEAIAELEAAATPASKDEMSEAIAFLNWLRKDHFAFLGARVYEFATAPDGSLLKEEPILLDHTGRGVLRDPQRHVLRRGSEPAILTPAIAEFLREPTPLIVAKSNMPSRVHRRVYMDYIGVKRYRDDGEVIGETRFVGLFTAEAYLAATSDVPLIRRKARQVLERAGKPEGSHSYKRLQNIIDTYPRDELFQSEEDELLQIGLGVLHLFDRPRPKLFVRRDRFDRFASAFVFIPRERYNSKLRERLADLLVNAYQGRLSAFYPAFSDGPLARVHFIIGLNPFDHPEPDVAHLEREIAALARTWEDDFDEVVRKAPDADRRAALRRFDGAFSAGYREAFSAEEAVEDIRCIESAVAGDGVHARVYRRTTDGEAACLRVKVYRIGGALPLSDVMPILEAMGLRVVSESPHRIHAPFVATDDAPDAASALPEAWVHDFLVRWEGAFDIETAGAPFEQALLATFRGENENDGFNRLVLALGVDWREVAFLRACARYRLQTGLDPAQAVQEQALADHPEITRLILDLKTARFDPALSETQDQRAERAADIQARLIAALDGVESLDADRVLRRIALLVAAIQRTNFYQRDEGGAAKPAVAIKIASRELDALPEPKPLFEIFVSAPHVEGVHIRFGRVARGGLRWSDRRGDFRTEVLGLVKAQVVKNAVIVPVGSKGGFFPKRLPRGGTREQIQAEGVRAYKSFIGALLDVTDNLMDGAVLHPAQCVVWDGEDPYLVVAADKGTATFSDIANEIAESRGFWLGDAFASGGSAGYDHKKMGITARGAWVATQRHFRELGKDIQNEPFTVIGVGDMSGDVFGNGMLLSKQIRLLAAFDHRDIFIDPDPKNPEKLWAERKRLFDLPRSTWRDYNTKLISKGGGVFSRRAKAVPLSPEIRTLTGLEGESAPPNMVISALLRAEAELLWFGGIGTYVKAAHEIDDAVGDKANDPLRVTADGVRVKVIGEGANLGVTQAGRIELDQRGVKLNADFIDNSGGVDSSDHEVNIKILLNPMVRAGSMALPDRNALLERMTDDVADKVLQHSYDQTRALTIAETGAVGDLDAHERLIQRLEARGQIDREVEELPPSEEIAVRKAEGAGLTRPELATLISHSKIALFDRILESSVPDDPHMLAHLEGYFPDALEPYTDAMGGHRLKREIIATILANDIVNIGGPTFTHRARESTGGDTDAVARGFEAARTIFGFNDVLREIDALDNVAPAAVQIDLYKEVIQLVRRQTYWLVRRGRGFEEAAPRPLAETIAAYRPGIEALREFGHQVISTFETDRVAARAARFVADGAPEDLAARVAGMRPLTSSSDVIDLAARAEAPLAAVAHLYHALGERFAFDQLRAVGGSLSSTEHWDRLATRRLIEDLYAEQQRLCALALPQGGRGAKWPRPDAAADWARERIEALVKSNAYEAARADEAREELSATGPWTLSKLSIAATAMREFGALASG